jgi:hypothetical protein
MNKKIALLCAIALIGISIILTLLGKLIEPHAKIPGAIIVPFGASAWEKVIMGQVESAKTRRDVENCIGPATNTLESLTMNGHHSLLFENPHDSSRAVVVSFDGNDRVKSIGPLIKSTSKREGEQAAPRNR